MSITWYYGPAGVVEPAGGVLAGSEPERDGLASHAVLVGSVVAEPADVALQVVELLDGHVLDPDVVAGAVDPPGDVVV